jgi:O-antigen/teichoic acid export membrane protein
MDADLPTMLESDEPKDRIFSGGILQWWTHKHKSQNNLLKESLGYLVSKVIPGMFGFISVPVFVRLLGVAEYGRLAVILPVILALGGAGAGWLQQGILRFHPPPQCPVRDTFLFAHAVSRGTRYAVLALGAVLVPILILLHYSLTVVAIVEVFLAVQLIYSVSLSRLQGEIRPRAVIVNEAIRSIGGFALPVIFILVSGHPSYSNILLGLSIGYAVPLILGQRSMHPKPFTAQNVVTQLVAGEGQDINRILGRLWRFGWAVGAWLMLCQALPVVGRSAIQRYAGYAQAGIYASLYEIAVRSFSLFASPVMQAAHPRIMSYWNQGDRISSRTTIRQAIRMQIVMFLPVEAIGIAFAAPFTRAILGPHASAPPSLLPLLMFGGFLWQIALIIHKPLEILQRTKTMLCGMLGVLLIEICGNYLLVPRFGMESTVYVFVFGAIGYILFAILLSRGMFSPKTELHLSSLAN